MLLPAANGTDLNEYRVARTTAMSRGPDRPADPIFVTHRETEAGPATGRISAFRAGYFAAPPVKTYSGNSSFSCDVVTT